MIRKEIFGKINVTNGVKVHALVAATFEYDMEEPLVFGVLFEWGDGHEQFWEFGRDLFIECVENGCAGSSDVILVDTGDWFGLTINTDQGNSVTVLPPQDVKDFIDETLKLLPQGKEDLEDAIDEAIEEILSGA